MKAWDFHEWHQTLTRTQSYFRNRICGDDCARDLVEAWRYFYQTHAPLVKVLVSRQGLAAATADACVRSIWTGVLVGLPKLRSSLSYDAFLYWLSQLVRSKADELRPPAGDVSEDRSLAGWPDRECATLSDPAGGSMSQLNARLFQMRVVEERSVEDVASALQLTPRQVTRRQDDMMQKILTILIKLDA